MFGFKDDFAKNDQKSLDTFAKGKGKDNAIKWLRAHAAELNLGPREIAALPRMNARRLHRIKKARTSHSAKANMPLNTSAAVEHQIDVLATKQAHGTLPQGLLKKHLANLIKTQSGAHREILQHLAEENDLADEFKELNDLDPIVEESKRAEPPASALQQQRHKIINQAALALLQASPQQLKALLPFVPKPVLSALQKIRSDRISPQARLQRLVQ